MIELDRRGFLALAALALPSCRRAAASPVVRVVLSPAHAPKDLGALSAGINAGAGQPIDLRVAASTSAALDLVQGEQVDAGLLPLGDFLFCWQILGAVPIAQARRGDRMTYDGEIAVRADSGVRDLAGLDRRRVAFVDPRSLTGFLLAAKVLSDARVHVEPVWLGSHDAALAALRDGRVDAATTYKGRAQGQADLRVIGATSSVPNEPLFVRPSLDPAAREALRRGFLGATPAALDGLAGITGFQDVSPRDYEEALKTVRAAGESVEDMLPGGWARANEHRRPIWSYAP